MNQYQKYLMNISKAEIFYSRNNEAKNTVEKLSYEKLVITQSEDISVTKYPLFIINKSIESVYLIFGKKEIKLKMKTEPIPPVTKINMPYFYSILDFENKADSLKIVFNNNLADDLIISIEYIEADKEKYYKKVEKAKKEDLCAKAQIKHSTGVNLVNIYFQPCCESYARTEIELYLAKGYFSEPSSQCITLFTPRLLGGEVEQCIGKYVINDGSLFKSISGLAKRVYGYKVKQFDINDKILFESDLAFFSIK